MSNIWTGLQVVFGSKMKQLPFMGVVCTVMLFIVYRTTNYQYQQTEVCSQYIIDFLIWSFGCSYVNLDNDVVACITIESEKLHPNQLCESCPAVAQLSNPWHGCRYSLKNSVRTLGQLIFRLLYFCQSQTEFLEIQSNLLNIFSLWRVCAKFVYENHINLFFLPDGIKIASLLHIKGKSS